MTTSCAFITSDHVITCWYSDLHVLISQLIQSKSALSQRCSALKTQCFRAKKISSELCWFRADSTWNNAFQRWNFQLWTPLILRKSELISSETALISTDVFHILWISAENVKALKQRSSALIISETSTGEHRVIVLVLWDKNMPISQRSSKNYGKKRFIVQKGSYQELRVSFHNRNTWLHYSNVSEKCMDNLLEEPQVNFRSWPAETAGKQHLKICRKFYLYSRVILSTDAFTCSRHRHFYSVVVFM